MRLCLGPRAHEEQRESSPSYSIGPDGHRGSSKDFAEKTLKLNSRPQPSRQLLWERARHGIFPRSPSRGKNACVSKGKGTSDGLLFLVHREPQMALNGYSASQCSQARVCRGICSSRKRLHPRSSLAMQRAVLCLASHYQSFSFNANTMST